MINIESLNNAIERIDAINSRFGITIGSPIPRDKGFANELAKAEDNLEKAEKAGKADETKSVAGGGKEANVSSPIGEIENKVSASISSGDTYAMIEEAARKYQVDARLVSAVAETESHGNQDAVSSAGAIGVMQLMPGTAASLGVNPYDKQQNIEGGAKYIRQMLDTFGGDVRKAVAAYNAGPQAVKDYGGIPPYRETQDYVNKVMDIYS